MSRRNAFSIRVRTHKLLPVILKKENQSCVIFCSSHICWQIKALIKHWCDSSVLVRAECLRCDCNCCCVDVSIEVWRRFTRLCFALRGAVVASSSHPFTKLGREIRWGNISHLRWMTGGAPSLWQLGLHMPQLPLHMQACVWTLKGDLFRMFQHQRVKKKKKKQPTHGTLCPACPSSPRLKPETQTLQMNPQRRQHTRSSLKAVTDLDLEASYSKHASHTHRNDRHAIPAPPVTRQPDLPRTEGEAHIWNNIWLSRSLETFLLCWASRSGERQGRWARGDLTEVTGHTWLHTHRLDPRRYSTI